MEIYIYTLLVTHNETSALDRAGGVITRIYKIMIMLLPRFLFETSPFDSLRRFPL